MLRYLTAGESHGLALVTIVEGLPAGVPVDLTAIDRDLARRQSGHGRGGRMRIEQDRVEVLSGIRHGETLGSPVALMVPNRDWTNWTEVMSARPVEAYSDVRAAQKVRTRPRPGHADLAGALKYDHADLRNVLERASARETAARVAAGSLAKQYLAPFGIRVAGYVRAIGPVEAEIPAGAALDEIVARAEASPVRCADPDASARMVEEIDAARRDGDSLGGVVEVVASGLPPGLGSHVHYDRRLDGALGAALLSIQAAKGVEIGDGFAGARRRGSQVHDEIGWSPERGYFRHTNRAGGLEGGMTTGMDLVARVASTQAPVEAHEHPHKMAGASGERLVDPCPECGSHALAVGEGCVTCHNCGYSKCS